MTYPANDNGDQEEVWCCGECGTVLFYVKKCGFECSHCGTIASFEESFGVE